MTPTYFLFGLDTHRVLRAGPRANTPIGFEGPTIYRLRRGYQLPPDLLRALWDRFHAENPVLGAKVLTEDEVFGPTFERSPDEMFPIVGGDADHDVPYEHYLPELQDAAGVARLIPVPDRS